MLIYNASEVRKDSLQKRKQPRRHQEGHGDKGKGGQEDGGGRERVSEYPAIYSVPTRRPRDYYDAVADEKGIVSKALN